MNDFADNFRIMGKVEPYSCWDGGEEFENVSNGGEEFEDILSALDFPMESLEDDGLVEDWDVSKLDFPPFDDMLPPTIAHNKIEFGSIDSTPETKHILPQEQGSFHTQSPVSVLENSAPNNSTTKSHTGKRPRSKRARPLGPSPWLLTSSPLFPTSTKNHNNSMTKNKERKIPFPEASHRPVVAKKCTHCEVTKTPQWRLGPLGPKTLCNACGVRYRSRRLLPEYRPAASPTFVPTLHSNSHKKVIEMRTKGKGKQNQLKKNELSMSMSPPMEFVPYLFEN